MQICRRITHPNVVRVYDIGRFPGGLFVTMEYLEGRTLDQRDARARAAAAGRRARACWPSCSPACRRRTQLRIVHRDLKPSNVILTGERLKILDFGIARMEGGDGSLTMTGEVLGSPKYMSPEQIQGEELDGRTDLYSLGVLAYAMLAGREPFTGNDAERDRPQAAPASRRRTCSQLRPDLPLAWQELLARLLAKRRDERYAGRQPRRWPRSAPYRRSAEPRRRWVRFVLRRCAPRGSARWPRERILTDDLDAAAQGAAAAPAGGAGRRPASADAAAGGGDGPRPPAGGALPGARARAARPSR